MPVKASVQGSYRAGRVESGLLTEVNGLIGLAKSINDRWPTVGAADAT
jgi:hypothetical protein